uniref:(northern house mosquito) hypothetical protein n=1 Tax=Culex pipiens TaxID=7175 RepID=A0A8D8FIV9_CULPI
MALKRLNKREHIFLLTFKKGGGVDLKWAQSDSSFCSMEGWSSGRISFPPAHTHIPFFMVMESPGWEEIEETGKNILIAHIRLGSKLGAGEDGGGVGVAGSNRFQSRTQRNWNPSYKVRKSESGRDEALFIRKQPAWKIKGKQRLRK